MATPVEDAVLHLLTAIEINSMAAGEVILNLGNEGVTVLCDAALGTYPGLRPKVRLNAVALLDSVNHPQARETMLLLLHDPDPDVSIRAIRGAARLRENRFVVALGSLLQQPALQPLVAAETVRALVAIDSPDARKVLDDYASVDPAKFPHRGSAVVNGVLQTRQR